MQTVTEIMKQDKDGDGKISKDEADDRIKARWEQNDPNGDGFVDRQEAKEMVDRIAAYMKQLQQNGGGAPAGPGGQ